MDIENLKTLISEGSDVNVSIYLPTFRNMPDKEQNPIRYKNLLNKAKKSVEASDLAISESYFDQAESLVDNDSFWNYVEDGLAVLITEETTQVIKTAGELPEKLVVGEELHILPLLDRFNFVDDSFILDISKDQFTLLHMSQSGLDELETENLENHFDELFDDKDFEGNIKSTGGSATSFHGQRSKSEEEEIEQEKYMRYLANGLNKILSQCEDRLIVFGTTDSVTEFLEQAEGKLEIDKTIEKPIKTIESKDLYDVIKENLLPDYIDKINEELEDLRSYVANDNGSFNPTIIQKDAEEGRVRKLFITTDYDDIEEAIEDKIINNTIRNGGEVEAINPDHLEFKEEIGTINRF